MGKEMLESLKTRCGEENYRKLTDLNNPELINFVAKYVRHCNPASVFVCTDREEDAEYIRGKSRLMEASFSLVRVLNCPGRYRGRRR